MRLSDYTVIVDEAIKGLDYPAGDLAGLYGPVSYGLEAGGKRIRPALVLMSAEAFGGEEARRKALSAALGMEMFHNFTLLHDDVMDDSDTRRGRPSVKAKWDVNTAILSGDTMLTLATEKVADVPDALLRPVLDAFNDMALRVYEGQRLDMDFEKRDDVSLDEYLRMIRLKTGALLGASAQIGALIGGATAEEAGKMYDYGCTLGLAFQIQDDWLDVYGDAATFGKPIGGDINNGKKSFLLLSALESRRPEALAVKAAMSMGPGDIKVKTVTNLYDKIGVSEMARKEAAHYSSQAITALKGTRLDDDARQAFRALADKLTGRKR